MMTSASFDLSGSESAWKQTSVGSAGNFVQPIPTDRGKEPYRLVKWRGEPGSYERAAGMPWNEIFVVYKGVGRLRMGGQTVTLSAGSIIELRKGIPYVLEIDETLEKMSVVNE
jgi:uncharacterized cupin superfamily protein